MGGNRAFRRFCECLVFEKAMCRLRVRHILRKGLRRIWAFISCWPSGPVQAGSEAKAEL